MRVISDPNWAHFNLINTNLCQHSLLNSTGYIIVINAKERNTHGVNSFVLSKSETTYGSYDGIHHNDISNFKNFVN